MVVVGGDVVAVCACAVACGVVCGGLALVVGSALYCAAECVPVGGELAACAALPLSAHGVHLPMGEPPGSSLILGARVLSTWPRY